MTARLEEPQFKNQLVCGSSACQEQPQLQYSKPLEITGQEPGSSPLLCDVHYWTQLGIEPLEPETDFFSDDVLKEVRPSMFPTTKVFSEFRTFSTLAR
jgi:hypothetical protein